MDPRPHRDLCHQPWGLIQQGGNWGIKLGIKLGIDLGSNLGINCKPRLGSIAPLISSLVLELGR